MTDISGSSGNNGNVSKKYSGNAKCLLNLDCAYEETAIRRKCTLTCLRVKGHDVGTYARCRKWFKRNTVCARVKRTPVTAKRRGPDGEQGEGRVKHQARFVLLLFSRLLSSLKLIPQKLLLKNFRIYGTTCRVSGKRVSEFPAL